MKTPYVPHIFGDEVDRRLRAHRGWLTAGVACSITWPSSDVCVEYGGEEYFLLGREREGKPSPPGITIKCPGEPDVAISKIYRFTSVLSWFLGGYVDVSGYISGSHPCLYGDPRTVYSTLGIYGEKSFSCNHMPVIESENARKALAFWREGMRLSSVHDSYAFLSFYKVIESQFSDSKPKVQWIQQSIENLTDDSGKRVAELRAQGIDVSRHLFESGRCAVAHASLDGEIVDPDIPQDRKRLSADLVVIRELARTYIRDVIGIPDARLLYRTRNRLAPWNSLLEPEILAKLQGGGVPDPDELSGLNGSQVAIGLWPDGPIDGLEHMTLHLEAVENGVVKVVLVNPSETILLVFLLDYRSGKAHTNLEIGGLLYGENRPNEKDVKAYATYFYKVLGNDIAELSIDGLEPIDCEVVIPVNIRPPNPDEAIQEAIERFKAEEAARNTN